MKVIPFIIQNTRLFKGCLNEHGEANGYVAIPPTNKYYGLPFDAPEVEALSVHGGVTYAEFATNKKTSASGRFKVKPEFVGKRNTLLTYNELWFLGEKAARDSR